MVRRAPGRVALSGVVAGLLAVAGGAPARAFDPLVFFGLREEPSPAPGPQTASFSLAVTVEGGKNGDVEQALRDASTLARLRLEPPADAESVVRLAEADLPRLFDALWGLGYYDGTVMVEVAGVPLRIGTPVAAFHFCDMLSPV